MGALMRVQSHMADGFFLQFSEERGGSSGQAVLIPHQQWKEEYSGEGMYNFQDVEGRFTISQGVPPICEADVLFTSNHLVPLSLETWSVAITGE